MDLGEAISNQRTVQALIFETKSVTMQAVNTSFYIASQCLRGAKPLAILATNELKPLLHLAMRFYCFEFGNAAVLQLRFRNKLCSVPAYFER